MKNQSYKLIVIDTAGADGKYVSLRAAEQLQQAKVVVYDSSISKNWLAWISANALKIARKNQPGENNVLAEKINPEIIPNVFIYGEIVWLRAGAGSFDELFLIQKQGVEIEHIQGVFNPATVVEPWFTVFAN